MYVYRLYAYTVPESAMDAEYVQVQYVQVHKYMYHGKGTDIWVHFPKHQVPKVLIVALSKQPGKEKKSEPPVTVGLK